MTFRKDGLLFVENLIFCCLMTVLCIVLIPIDQLGIFPYIALFFVILAVLSPLIHNEFVRMDDEGISCRKYGKILWTYRWEDVVKLKKSSRYKMPSIEIITDINSNEWMLCDYSKHYFQLGRTARKAMDLYYKKNLF